MQQPCTKGNLLREGKGTWKRGRGRDRRRVRKYGREREKERGGWSGTHGEEGGKLGDE
jgi:hypothetical protein